MDRLLLIDDDAELCEMLQEYLAAEGFAVRAVHDGAEGAALAREGDGFDVVVLDVMLPSLNGFEVLRRLRESSQVPVLMLTARGDEVDRIVGLEMGADDYLPKPFNPRELAARLRAVQRRGSGVASPEICRAGRLVLHPGSRRALLDGKPLELTSTEFELLLVLARQAGRPVSKARLSEEALGRRLARFDRSIDMHVSNLRRKLGDPRLIETVRGRGYQLVAD